MRWLIFVMPILALVQMVCALSWWTYHPDLNGSYPVVLCVWIIVAEFKLWYIHRQMDKHGWYFH